MHGFISLHLFLCLESDYETGAEKLKERGKMTWISILFPIQCLHTAAITHYSSVLLNANPSL